MIAIHGETRRNMFSTDHHKAVVFMDKNTFTLYTGDGDERTMYSGIDLYTISSFYTDTFTLHYCHSVSHSHGIQAERTVNIRRIRYDGSNSFFWSFTIGSEPIFVLFPKSTSDLLFETLTDLLNESNSRANNFLTKSS